MADATQARDRLAGLADQVTGLVAPVLAARTDQARHQATVEENTTAAATLTAITVPDGLTARDAALAAARGEHDTSAKRAQQASADLTDAIAAQDAGPQRPALETVERLYTDQAQVAADLTGAQQAAETTKAAADAAQKADTAAADALREARTVLEQAHADRDATAGEVTRLTDLVARLRAVTVPADLEQVAAAATDAAAQVAAAEQVLADAKSSAARAATGCEGLPDPRTLTVLETDLETLTGRVRVWDENRTRLTELDRTVQDTQATLTRAQTARDAAWATLEQARTDDAAATLRPTLVLGHECPVCTHTVTELPPPANAAGVEAATGTWQHAEQALTAAETTHRAAATDAAKLRDRVDAQHADLIDLVTRFTGSVASVAADAGLTEQPLVADDWSLSVTSVDELAATATKTLAMVGQRCAEAFADRTRTASAVDVADQTLTTARKAAQARQQQADALRTMLVRTHAGVEADGAPPVSADTIPDAVAGWRALDAWCRESATTTEKHAAPAARAAADAAERTHRQAGATFTRAEQAAAKTSRAARDAAAAAAAEQARVEHLTRRRTELAEQLTGAPASADLPDLLTQADRLAAERSAAAAAQNTARRAADETQQRVQDAQQAVAADRDALGTARDLAAAWGPPTFDGTRLADDLAGCWTDLAAWAQQAAKKARTDATAAQKAAAASGRDADRLLAALTAELHQHDLPTTEVADDPRAAERLVAVAHTQAAGRVETLTKEREQVGDLEAKRAAATERALVAGELRALLRSDKFQQWLATAALDTLVAGASDGLRQLSDGQFTLTHDKGDFFVIDHFDADSSRSVKTLSGGETFQASLALALALSEQLAALAIGGSARLDSIFLDEGFGTLDPESLETVAATLETLAQGDRMVGVVTHVAALAERTPVRFSVSHDHRTSRIEREAL